MNELMLNGIGMTSKRTRERLVSRLQKEGITSSKVLDTIQQTPRHIFVDEALSHRAYEDTALPIGFSQTLSQPYIVARMTELLIAGGPLQRVLEVGTGSGYQTAVLAQLADEVFSVERIRALQKKAAKRLNLLGLHNICLKVADGHMGWEQQAPFDGIMVTAAPAQLPQLLIDQLAVGGRMIVPVGNDEEQILYLVTKTAAGEQIREIEKVRFVPLLAGLD
ncbi:protein-L-isoaspartate(D-aspartate) O-methyltransferase [Spartinivicinus poritis]|uniref:Protein-L-isoaspartate O-methyltransferase n=1 Tax=Spartinivicinus poritis TaxID=2994640 RepID=A0ABT5U1X5_9GAMM|nr:protein-L-isoaspartate(D-aspartate) O-methyltransferase [Spartinivicinus sp. A2-2]MDE1460373.1 protein-L-isoaspartate(D-aspartate) O-methyltransferase [Spartinivicinus sp. A2-2]